MHYDIILFALFHLLCVFFVFFLFYFDQVEFIVSADVMVHILLWSAHADKFHGNIPQYHSAILLPVAPAAQVCFNRLHVIIALV